MSAKLNALYELDFIGWTEQQARLLRDTGARDSNLPLDWAHLAEEIEDLGKSELHTAASQFRRIMLHLLKLELLPATQPRLGWLDSVADARSELESLLESDPGLRPRLADIIRKEAPRATRDATDALRRYGETAASDQAAAAGADRYTEAQLLGDWLPERPDLS